MEKKLIAKKKLDKLQAIFLKMQVYIFSLVQV